ncbi:MAG: hypothetical protein GX542_13560 [Rhodococcus sp.]|nr:hypothetical protein [Rhodococcus sp. (in: high G+C Gram-positive bacteria)]
MRRGQSNQWPRLPALAGGFHLPGEFQRRVGLGLVVVYLLLVLTACGGGSAQGEATVPPCADSQCLTPTPEPGVEGGAAPTPSATPAISSPVAATPGTTESALAEATAPADQPVFQSDLAVLGPVQWATEIDPTTHAPRQQVDSFPTDAPVIYAVLAVDHLAAGTTIQAQWTYNRTRLESFDQSMVVESEVRNTWLEFHLALTQPGAWPRGQYDLAVLVNGDPAVTGSVNVIASP